MIFLTRISKFNTIISGSKLNTGLNPIAELCYGKDTIVIKKQPNNIDTLCQYNIDVMKDQFSDSSGKIRRAEKELVDKGILTLNNTTKKYKNGFPITERILHLDKVQLGRFVVESILDHEQRIVDVENKVFNNEHEINQLKTYMNSILEFVATLDPEKVQNAIEKFKK